VGRGPRGGERAGAVVQRGGSRGGGPTGGRGTPLRRAQQGPPAEVHPGPLCPAQDAGQRQLRQST